METVKFEDLLLDPDNPRDITEDEFAHLKASLKKFGDLGGFVRNLTTGMLVGGHQRKRAFDSLGGQKRVVITQRFEAPNRHGTVAVGHIEHDGELYSYREVEWSEAVQKAANIAANRIGGTFNLDKLAEINYKLMQGGDEDLLKLTGQSDKEIKELLAMVSGEPPIDLPDGEKDGFQQVTFTLSDDQAETVFEALGHVKANNGFEQSKNKNSNGNAVYMLAKEHLDRLHGQANDQSSKAN